jgi:hypothetical protein
MVWYTRKIGFSPKRFNFLGFFLGITSIFLVDNSYSQPMPDRPFVKEMEELMEKLPDSSIQSLLQYTLDVAGNQRDVILQLSGHMTPDQKKYLLAKTRFDVYPRQIELPAKVSWERTSFNLGEIIAGEKVATEFIVKNIGENPYAITAVKSSCPCLIWKFPSYAIPPGESAKVYVIFDSEKRVGALNVESMLLDNSSPNFRTILSLTGEVFDSVADQR